MDNFEAIIGRLMLAHAQLRAIDPSLLSDARRAERSNGMRDLRKAVSRIVALEYGTLSAAGKQSAQDLEKATSELKEALAEATSAVQVVKAIGAGVRVIVNLIGLTV